MLQIQTSLKSSQLRNFIGDFARPPASYSFFRDSIEGIRSPPTQRTSNPRANSHRVTSQATPQRGTSSALTQRSNTQQTSQGNNNSQRAQRDIIPQISTNETGWIVRLPRGRNPTLQWMTGGVRLCSDYCFIGQVCNHVGENCPNGLHDTYEQLSSVNKGVVSCWIDNSHSLTWPAPRQGN